MNFLSERYITIMEYHGFRICALKVAVPAQGDELGYVIVDAGFAGQVFHLLDDAVQAVAALSAKEREGERGCVMS